MNRHEDDDLGHPSSTSSRHGSSLLKYDDITILIGKLAELISFDLIVKKMFNYWNKKKI